MRSKFFVVVSLLAVIALGFGACGGGDDNKSSACEITSVKDANNAAITFSPSGNNTFTGTYPVKESEIGNVSLTIEYSDKARISPNPATARDYTGNGQTFTVTAEDDTPKTWTVVTKGTP